jgi:predicted transcriptional regulator of viral defense system
MTVRSRGAVLAQIEALQAQGSYAFCTDELAARLPVTRTALNAALRRLVAAGRLTRLGSHQPFFVIVPPEYRTAGAPPPAWILDAYMRFLEAPYYLGLLSAAEWYGATHFALPTVQVVTAVQRRPVLVGKTAVAFVTKRSAARTPVRVESTPGGPVRVSTPAATMLDLVRFPRPGGGVSRVATSLAVLRRGLTAPELREVLDESGDTAAAQRLGFLLERLGAEPLAAVVERWLRGRARPRVRLLDPAARPGGAVSARWQVRENVPVEVTT